MIGKSTARKRLSLFFVKVMGGDTAQAVCREHNISDQKYIRWKKKYGDMELADANMAR